MSTVAGLVRATLAVSLCAAATDALAGCSSTTSCVELENTPLADDEPTPEGVTATDVLSIAGAPHEVVLVWEPGVTNAAAGETRLTIAVERTAETARRIVTERRGHQDIALECGPTLRVPVRLRLTTPDGLLSDAFESDLVYDLLRGPVGTTGTATFSADVSFEDLNGSLRPLDPSFDGELSAVLGNLERGWIGLTRVRDAGEDFDIAAHWGSFEQ